MTPRERLYRVPVEGTPWQEIDSESDGMCGYVTFENPETTALVSYHWSVTHPTCRSQHEARRAARQDFLAEAGDHAALQGADTQSVTTPQSRPALSADAHEAVRVAATVLAAARMQALADRSTAELIALYWDCRAAEAEKEARDRALDSTHPDSWDWSEKAAATARDGGVEILKEAIQRVFAARRVKPSEVWGGR